MLGFIGFVNTVIENGIEIFLRRGGADIKNELISCPSDFCDYIHKLKNPAEISDREKISILLEASRDFREVLEDSILEVFSDDDFYYAEEPYKTLFKAFEREFFYFLENDMSSNEIILDALEKHCSAGFEIEKAEIEADWFYCEISGSVC